MRKRTVARSESEGQATLGPRLDLARIATAELSSEDPANPLEPCLPHGSVGRWRAATPGEQTIRLIFDTPQQLRNIRLEFHESEVTRSQEFELSVMTSRGTRGNVIRQQWTFSPMGSTLEVEDYAVELDDVISVILDLDPGRHDRSVFATLHSLSCS